MSAAVRLHAIYLHGALALATVVVDDQPVSVTLDLDEAAMRDLIAPHIMLAANDDGVVVDVDRIADLRKQFAATLTRHYSDPNGRAAEQIRIQNELHPLQEAARALDVAAAMFSERERVTSKDERIAELSAELARVRTLLAEADAAKRTTVDDSNEKTGEVVA